MKFCEAHSGLSALLVEKSDYNGIWVSSLTHAAIDGLPDNETTPIQHRVELVWLLRDLKITKPILVDVDTLARDDGHVAWHTGRFARGGAWGIVIEDKKGTKQNSLLGDAKHEMEDVDTFCNKIRVAKENAGDMKVFARLESLIAKRSKHDALIRANAYLEAGADGILIHSKAQVDCTEVMEVGNALKGRTTLIAVPTTYTLPEEHPFDIVIHANHLLRASMKAMQKYINGEEVELASVQDIFDLVGH